MNNYPSSNFPTVFFLVVIFIGMGLLMYHAYEITVDNNQLKQTVASLQDSTSILMSENTALQTANAALAEENSQLKASLETTAANNASLSTEIAALQTTNAALAQENSQLKANLETAATYSASLNNENAVLRAANATLTEEKSQLQAALQNAISGNSSVEAVNSSLAQSSEPESLNTGREVFLSTFLPGNLDPRMKVVLIILAVALLAAVSVLYVQLKIVPLRRAIAVNGAYNAQAKLRNGRYVKIVDGRFVDR